MFKRADCEAWEDLGEVEEGGIKVLVVHWASEGGRLGEDFGGEHSVRQGCLSQGMRFRVGEERVVQWKVRETLARGGYRALLSGKG